MTSLVHKIKTLTGTPRIFWIIFAHSPLFRYLPDKTALEIQFQNTFHRKIDWDNPKTFNEKLQWLKLYNRKPEYTTMVDKYAAKAYAASIIGEEHIIPTLGVWDRFEEIDFDNLPDQFVLKCTHGSGDAVICRDKAQFDIESARKKINSALQKDFYKVSREWPYKNVQRRIIAEEYMTDTIGKDSLTDYKFYCFGGKADCVMVCLGRNQGKTQYFFFDKEWRLKRLNISGINAASDFSLPKPECIDKMFEVAELLSDSIPFSRIDLYQCQGNIYFGEITFFPTGGFDVNILPETDKYWGNLIKIRKGPESVRGFL